MTHTTTHSPIIQVACLGCYNAGKTVTLWVDADQDFLDLEENIQEVFDHCPDEDHEEWLIIDAEDFPYHLLGDYPNTEDIAELASLIAKHGDLAADVYAYWDNMNETRDALDENYLGAWDSLKEYGEHLIESAGDLPEHYWGFFDFERFAESLELGSDIYTIESGDQVHVFHH